jgi:hypothetical protein
MSFAPIEFPLTLRPVVRSREAGEPSGRRLPYHAAIIIVDRAGRHVLHVAPSPDDLRAGRVSSDPHKLVSRASRVVSWLYGVHGLLEAWVAGLESSPALLASPFIVAKGNGTSVDAGVRLCTAPDEEFDRITCEVQIFASEEELGRSLDPLRERVYRKYEAALKILTALQDAVHSWRITEGLASSGEGALTIEDSSVEH